MQKNWGAFNISALMEIPAYHLGPANQRKSPEYQKESDAKKTRTCFSRAQVAVLEERFKVQKYITQTERIQLAEQLCMTDNQVKTWFQNRRTKWRRQEADTNYVKQPMDMGKYFEYSEMKNN